MAPARRPWGAGRDAFCRTGSSSERQGHSGPEAARPGCCVPWPGRHVPPLPPNGAPSCPPPAPRPAPISPRWHLDARSAGLKFQAGHLPVGRPRTAALSPRPAGFRAAGERAPGPADAAAQWAAVRHARSRSSHRRLTSSLSDRVLISQSLSCRDPSLCLWAPLCDNGSRVLRTQHGVPALRDTPLLPLGKEVWCGVGVTCY